MANPTKLIFMNHNARLEKNSDVAKGGSSAPINMKKMLFFLIFIEISSGFVQGFYTPLQPEFADYLGVASSAMLWFQTAQALAAAVCVPLISRLGDQFGYRKLLRAVMLVVLVGTLVTALVPSYPVVLVGRVLVGPLGVWLPLTIALAYSHITGEKARKSISLLSASLMGGIVLGTLAAGLAEALAPNLVIALLIPVVMVAISTYAVFFQLPESLVRTNEKIDGVGFAGLAIVMVVFIVSLAFTGPSTMKTALILYGVTVVCLILWVVWERRTPSPAVDLKLMGSRRLGPLYLTGFLMGIVIIDAPTNLSDFLSKNPDLVGYGFSATPEIISGLIAVILIFATISGALFSNISKIFGLRPTLVGGAILAGLGQSILIPFNGSLLMFWISSVATGIGLGILVGSLPALVAEGAPRDKTGIATGLYNSLLAMGGAVGGAVFRQVLAAYRDADKVVALQGYEIAWAICVGVFVVAAIMMSFVELPEGDLKKHH